MRVGVSTACLYPELLENALFKLLESGINTTEIFINSHCELDKKFVENMARVLNDFNAKCVSLHPYTCALEPMMFFSAYERRISDILEYYRVYFEVMNKLNAKIFIFHGNKIITNVHHHLYFERFHKLFTLGKEYGITVTQENVARCQSSALSFLTEMSDYLGDDVKFTLDVKQAIRSNEDPFNIVNTLKSKIIHTHISDNGPNGDCLLIGEGTFDINLFLKTLKGFNYSGDIILELYRSNYSTVLDLNKNYNKIKNIIKHEI